MTPAKRITLLTLLLALVAIQALPWAAGLAGVGKPVAAVVVRESTKPLLLTANQTAWIMSRQLRDDCRAAGISLEVQDPDVKDRDGITPAHLVLVIAKAKEFGMPCLILVGSRGGLVASKVPADETAARSLIMGVR